MRGRIKKALSGFYYVDTGEEVVTCRARGRFRKEGVSPLVGDRVEITVSGTEGMVDAIEPRRNVFSRPAVANIDQLVIVASNAIPQTDPYLIDRMTAIAALKGCEVLICINKSDLDHADELCAIYEKAGLPFLLTSAETGGGHCRAAGAYFRQAVCLYRQFRRWEIEPAQCARPTLFRAGRRGQSGARTRTPHHAPCGAVYPLRRRGDHRHARLYLL